MSARPLRAVVASFVVSLAFVLTSAIGRAAFGIDPTLVTVEPGDRVAVVKITNTGLYARSYEAAIRAWTQIGGVRHLEPTSDVIVSPPVFSLDAGQTQTLRIGLLHPSDRDVEKSYRVTVGELPAAAHIGNGIETLVHVSVPVFFRPRGAPARPKPSVSFERAGARDGLLRIDDVERVHLRLDGIRITDRAGTLFEASHAEYLLPEQELSLPVTLRREPDGPLVAHVKTDDGDFTFPLSARP